MSNSVFIGRKVELERLTALYKKKNPSLVVVKGRRRIGKSRLIGEFAKISNAQIFWSFAGLAPQNGISAQQQRDNFARQLALMLKIPPMTFLDWSDAFEHLSLHLKPGDIILLDEISWMGSKDPSFIPKLKAWWDKQTMHVLLVFCGPVSTWIEENILKSTAFFGRINLTISLEPLSIPENAEFLRTLGMQLSHYDMYKLLSIEFAHSGTLSQMMDHLIVAGFVIKQSLWSFKTAEPLKQSLYRISDPYMRFYLKVIEPNLGAIADGGFDQVPLSTMPGFETHMGLQLEALLLQNRPLLLEKLGISPIDIVRGGPYRQTKTNTKQGCQIDFLIQTKTNSLFICEFKFKKREISGEIISEMQDKISRLKTPKGFAKIAVLFHLSGVASSVATNPYFYRIVDIADFLEWLYNEQQSI